MLSLILHMVFFLVSPALTASNIAPNDCIKEVSWNIKMRKDRSTGCDGMQDVVGAVNGEIPRSTRWMWVDVTTRDMRIVAVGPELPGCGEIPESVEKLIQSKRSNSGFLFINLPYKKRYNTSNKYGAVIIFWVPDDATGSDKMLHKSAWGGLKNEMGGFKTIEAHDMNDIWDIFDGQMTDEIWGDRSIESCAPGDELYAESQSLQKTNALLKKALAALQEAN